jgi:uncharacterized membrane protein
VRGCSYDHVFLERGEVPDRFGGVQRGEEESIAELVGRLREVVDKLDGPAGAVPVDDGSKDAAICLC